jgi:hypothetical protein
MLASTAHQDNESYAPPGVLVTTKLPCSRCGAQILPTTTARTGGLCMPCFSDSEDRGQESEIARIFVRAMRHVRRNVMTDSRIVLSVMDYSEGPGVPFFAYAELFNGAETLARLRAKLYPGARWDYLDLERSRVLKV